MAAGLAGGCLLDPAAAPCTAEPDRNRPVQGATNGRIGVDKHPDHIPGVILVLYLVQRLPLDGCMRQIVQIIVIIIGIISLLKYLAVF